MPQDEISVQRFLAKTSTDHDEWFGGTKCMLWTASHGTKSGHGRFWDTARRCWVAHRFAWEGSHGPVPDGMRVSHRCRNKLCVNVEHLELITVDEMIRRRVEAFTPAPTFRCCGRPRTPENCYPSSRKCRACHKVQQRASDKRRKQR